MCVLTGYEDEARERGTRARCASDEGGGTLTFTVRMPPRSAAVHHAGLEEGEAKAARPRRAAARGALCVLTGWMRTWHTRARTRKRHEGATHTYFSQQYHAGAHRCAASGRPRSCTAAQSGRVPARERLLRTGMLGLGLQGLAALWPRAGGGEVGEDEGGDDLRSAVRLLATGVGPMETYAGAGARLGGHLKGLRIHDYSSQISAQSPQR